MSNTLINCKFHLSRIGKEDVHPSLNVDLEQGVFLCHGCGARGSLKQYPELVEEAQRVRGEGRPLTFVAPQSFAIPPLGGFVLDYLIRRGFSRDVLSRFCVGGNTDRAWIPVMLQDGSTIGVIFRFLDGDSRYVYSYGFRKRNCVFGSYQFESGGEPVCVVEGALDCIKMHQIGVKNTVSLLGDQPSGGQLDLLKQLGHTIVLALDNDEPGREASISIGKLLQHRGHEVLLLNYEGTDPGELKDTRSFELQPFLSYLLERR